MSARQLKTDLMAESVVDVTCNRPQDAISEVEHFEEIKGVALFGRTLHVVVTESEAAIRALEKAPDRAWLHG